MYVRKTTCPGCGQRTTPTCSKACARPECRRSEGRCELSAELLGAARASLTAGGRGGNGRGRYRRYWQSNPQPALADRNGRTARHLGTGMALFRLRAAHEVRASQYGSAEGDLGADMVAIAKAIIEQRTGEFDPSTYRDLTTGRPRLPQQLSRVRREATPDFAGVTSCQSTRLGASYLLS